MPLQVNHFERCRAEWFEAQDLATPQPTSLLLTLSSLPPLLAASPQLTVDLHPELVKQLSHSRPVIRRTALLVLGRMWSSPELSVAGQHEMIERLRDRLADDDQGVVSATVNVLLELTRKCSGEEAVPFLALAPELFGFLTGSTNNWMLIKIIKIVRCHEALVHAKIHFSKSRYSLPF